MPFAMGVIVVLLFLFMSGLYLEHHRTLAMKVGLRHRAPADDAKQIQVGDVKVGGDAPVVVQSMCSTDTADVVATVRRSTRLAGRWL